MATDPHLRSLNMTQINYPDLTRSSPSGEFTLEVRSPDNDPECRREDSENFSRRLWGGFQRDFTFALRSTVTGKIVWQRDPDHESPIDMPIDAWVSDAGHAVVITRSLFSSIMFLLNGEGEICFQCDVLSTLLENTEDELHWTSAGPHWNHRGAGLFVSANSSMWWCFRTQRLRQIAVNLNEAWLGTYQEVELELKQAQSKWAIETVRRAADDEQLFGLHSETEAPTFDDPEEDEAAHQLFVERYRYHESVWTAIFWCGVDKLTAAIPYLEKLEESTVRDGYTSGWSTSSIDKTWFTKLTLVPVSQMAMRCMGHQPAGIAGYWLCDDSPSSPCQSSRIRIPERIADRTARLRTICVGMSKHDVVQHVGMPDVDWRHWDYDVMSGTDRHTLRIDWSNRDLITQTHYCSPGWYEPASRAIWL